MRILADQNIPFAEQAFAQFGHVATFVGRELTAKDVHDAEILLVRSVTKVDHALLKDSAVKFVGSATIGTDHIALDYLQQHDISFANAPGSNATSAAEYVLAGLLHFATQQAVDVTTLQIGIVGYGNVGSRVANLLRALDIQCHIFDPPRQQQWNDIEYCDWRTICECDVVTAHVPLTRDGPYPTYRMFDSAFFSVLKTGALFINTARGAAVDETALLSRLASQRPLHLILDVWQHEPRIHPQLVAQTLLSTPHIAGYAYEGKLRGTQMIYQAACERFGLRPQWTMQEVLTDGYTKLHVGEGAWIERISALVPQAYDITQDSEQLRQILSMDDAQAAAHFDALRKHYPKRREFSHYTVEAGQFTAPQARVIAQLGFRPCQ